MLIDIYRDVYMCAYVCVRETLKQNSAQVRMVSFSFRIKNKKKVTENKAKPFFCCPFTKKK